MSIIRIVKCWSMNWYGTEKSSTDFLPDAFPWNLRRQGTSLHLRKTMADYWLKNLPEENKYAKIPADMIISRPF